MIARSKRPILIVGLGVLWAKASPELVQFAERIGAPVAVRMARRSCWRTLRASMVVLHLTSGA